MPVYGEGECPFELVEVCRLGDKGITVDPIYCLTCSVLELAKALKERDQVQTEDEEEVDESKLH